MRGVYGNVRPAIVDIANDVEILYYYRPTRGTESEDFSEGFKSLDPETCLIPTKNSVTSGTTLNGLYNLRLPLTEFNMKGIYTIFIRPKEIETTIYDVSVLENHTDIRGIVFSSDSINNIKDLSGYRVEYYTDEGEIEDTTRLITTSNYCIPISDGQSIGSKTYRIDNSNSDLVFCTVTPSSANSFRPGTKPYIGKKGSLVHLINTNFNPIMMEIEMVENDADTLSTLIGGTQIRDLDNSRVVTYTSEGEAYREAEYYDLKDSLGNPLYEVRKKLDSVETQLPYDDIINQ